VLRDVADNFKSKKLVNIGTSQVKYILSCLFGMVSAEWTIMSLEFFDKILWKMYVSGRGEA
jgi:hypothetical protein